MLRDWRRRRILKRSELPEDIWHWTLERVPLAADLPPGARERLRKIVTLFLHEKSIEGAGGLEVDDGMRLLIAAQACLPILALGLDHYDGWVSVIVYPDEFVPHHEYTDEYGVVHTTHVPLTGEAWPEGPMILSWPDVEDSLADPDDGMNVVIHECAHKLDMLNGAANGMPPLHRDMDMLGWTRDWSRAYEAFCGELERGEDTLLDPYGAEAPAEFFAVASEAFFEIPALLDEEYPALYEQLRTYYRQDPLRYRIPRSR
jgi:MtfA peptidase